MSSAADVLPSPVSTDAGDDDVVHIGCEVKDATWCGAPCEDWRDKPPNIEEVCRVCLLVLEMSELSGVCPVCCTTACIG